MVHLHGVVSGIFFWKLHFFNLHFSYWLHLPKENCTNLQVLCISCWNFPHLLVLTSQSLTLSSGTMLGPSEMSPGDISSLKQSLPPSWNNSFIFRQCKSSRAETRIWPETAEFSNFSLQRQIIIKENVLCSTYFISFSCYFKVATYYVTYFV